MNDQNQIDKALAEYKKLKAKLGKIPSSRDFYNVFSKKGLSALFIGGRAYSRLQELAGDAPNKFSSAKTPLSRILQQWGELARSTLRYYSKLPVLADWINAGLSPTISGIKKSYGVKWSELPELFHQHFAGNTEWQDILDKIEPKSESAAVNNRTKNEECFVYLMMDLRNRSHKIGISNNPWTRERTLQSEQPRTKLVAFKKYINRKMASAMEKALHEIYSHKKKRGEWFDLDTEDINELKQTLDDTIG